MAHKKLLPVGAAYGAAGGKIHISEAWVAVSDHAAATRSIDVQAPGRIHARVGAG
jgi:hypothetical protein